VLETGGIFAFNIETTAADFHILPSGRFAHAMSYIESLAAQNFETVTSQTTMLRLEAAQPVAGALILLRRR
jgi:predicted TPR repeat methyltransferase